MKRPFRNRRFQAQIIILVLIAIAGAAVRLVWKYNPTLLLTLTHPTKTLPDECSEILAPNALLKRDQILKLLSIAEQSSKARVRAILKTPYCKLKPITVRAGAISEREVYPLESDPTLWLIVLYESNEYVGIQIVPRDSSCTSKNSST